jgi:hypothetical protein
MLAEGINRIVAEHVAAREAKVAVVTIRGVAELWIIYAQPGWTGGRAARNIRLDFS